MNRYLPAFLSGFFGRPITVFLITLRTDLSYIAPLIIGFIPALNRRISTVFFGTSRAIANSDNVNPSMFTVYNGKKISQVETTTLLLYKRIVKSQKIVKKVKIFFEKHLTNCSNNNYNYNITIEEARK